MRRLVGLMLVTCAGAAQANPADVFGLGSRSAAMGGAVAASADDFSAAHYDPAGLAFGEGEVFSIGGFAFGSGLKINDRPASISDPVSVTIGATAPMPFGGKLEDRVHVGLAMVLLPTHILRIVAHLPDEPFYPYYDNRSQRLVVLPAIAVKVTPKIAVGVAFNVLAGLAGQVIAVEGPTRGLEPRADEEVGTQLAVNAGVRWAALPVLDLALVFREHFSVPFATAAQSTVAGEPIDLDLRANGLYTPDEIVLGQRAKLGAFDLTTDLVWSRWSQYPGPYVRVLSDLPLVGPIAGQQPTVPWKDAIALRLGGEWTLSRQVALRLGYGYETSPVPSEQPGVTNLLDGPKHRFSLGIGVQVAKRARLDAHLMLELVGARTLHKKIGPAGGDPFDALTDEVTDDPNDPATLGAQISNPGYPSISSGGQVYSGGLTLEIGL